jgi:hypothetical protein
MREAVLATVTVAGAPAPRAQEAADPTVTHAVALRSLLADAGGHPSGRLTGSETALLREWLDRLADPPLRQ